MSCPKNNRSFAKKPKLTSAMKKQGKIYLWREIKNNPNLYCWIPVSKRNVNPLDLKLDEVSIQDIPIPPIPDNYEDIMEVIAEEADKKKQAELIGVARAGVDIVSADVPEKYPVVKKFIKDKKLKLYGGAAINMYMPREDKFYNPRDIPDYDVYSPNPWDDAVELADILYKAGYEYTEARAGVHKGTYKVYANLWAAADISYMPREQFDRMETRTIDGMLVVSPSKLLESMYKEFSEPMANAARWPKVAKRMKLLEKWEDPLTKRFACPKDIFLGGKKELNPVHATLLVECSDFIKDKKLLYYGPTAYNTYIEIGGGGKRVTSDHYRVLSESAKEDIEELFTKLLRIHQKLEIRTIHRPSRELNNMEYEVYAMINGEPELIINITVLSSCTPYKYLLGKYVVAIDYVKYDLYDTVVFQDKKVSKDAKCKLRYLTKIQYNYYVKMKVTENDDTPFQRYVIKCKGPFQHNLKVEILNRWEERVERMKDIQKIRTKTHYIKKYPREKIPEECANKNEHDCTYPCAWNKHVKQCYDIPKGSYRPGEEDDEHVYKYK